MSLRITPTRCPGGRVSTRNVLVTLCSLDDGDAASCSCAAVLSSFPRARYPRWRRWRVRLRPGMRCAPIDNSTHCQTYEQPTTGTSRPWSLVMIERPSRNFGICCVIPPPFIHTHIIHPYLHKQASMRRLLEFLSFVYCWHIIVSTIPAWFLLIKISLWNEMIG